MKRIQSLIGIGLLAGLSACGGESSGSSGTAPDAAALAGLRSELDAIAFRLELVEDAKAIKRLQRAYGYYLDHGRWSDLADLFAEDSSLEIGLDGVYRGRERIRAYFSALGKGREGLAPGQLNEHMQLMPVVTVAPDGLSAKGRWRDIIMLGRFGEFAAWGEGPFENEYVKQDGVWKISRLHWFQTMLVDFDGGWHENEDFNGARWVGDALTPDAPPSVNYAPWPGTSLPPFHFENPVLGAAAADPGASAPRWLPESAGLEAIAGAAGRLGQSIALLDAGNAIENLQRIYGFYIEEGFWSEAADLFADEGVFEIAGSGQFIGQSSIRAYLRSLGEEFPQAGRLYDQMQLQPIVDVAPDGRTARARWRLFAQEAEYGEFAEWGVGWYENDYVLDDGVWKIAHLRQFNRMYTPDQEGWARTALPGPSVQLASDRAFDAPSGYEHALYPAVPEPAFHYPNPVTGGAVFAGSIEEFASVPALAGAAEASALLARLADRVERLEDIEQIERLQGVYGYYLASYSMDDLAGIFSDDGTIEIALRGVYAGKASVRRNLDLYPPVDLHNHMQYQPVIHLSEDGSSAKMRSRALSIMGSYGQYSMWMGGIYENDFVEQDGVWKLSKDQVFNTYFINYAEGWKNNRPRPPPGISADNPPDAPPTVQFEMYPAAFLPPYHYANPVTGNSVSWTATEDQVE